MTSINISSRTRSLVLTKSFAAKAAVFGTDEYKMLQEARRDYPGYKVTVGKAKNKEQKNIYAGLDYAYMEKYIAAHDDEEKTIMAEYLDLRGLSDEAKELQAVSASFLEIRSWFLKKYPAIEEFYTKRAALLGKAAAKPETKTSDKSDSNAAESTAA